MGTTLTLIFISAASLAFQVALTRYFALSQGHHFAFMAISLALLGIGASGSYLSLRQPRPETWHQTFSRGTLLFTLSLPAAYLIINYLPFDAYQIAWDRRQFLWLVLYYLALTIPFFFSGLVIGVALTSHSDRAGAIYAANLVGSGLGPVLALLTMAWVGGPGTLFFCMLLGWLGVISSHLSGLKRTDVRFVIYGAVPVLLLGLTTWSPPVFQVQLTPYKSLSQALLYPGSRLVFSQWNAFSRVDVLQSEGIRSAPGLSFTFPDKIPTQRGLLIDGDNLSPITIGADATFTQFLPLALPFQLRPAAQVLILEPGGGLATLTALDSGAAALTIVQSNHTAVEAIRTQLAHFEQNTHADPRLTIIIDEPRSYLRRSGQQFDLILLPLTDSFRPVTAGAYTLGEDYRYTVEAFTDALNHLSPTGLLVAERWLQMPPSESLRLWGTIVTAAQRTTARPLPDVAPHLAAIRSLQTALVMASPTPLASDDLAAIRQFATQRQFDLVWLPDLAPTEVNRYSIVPNEVYHQTFQELLTTPDPAAFYASYSHEVSPPNDDHPFFFHFFKWQQTPEILQSLGKTWQPFGGSGYLVLVILLILVLILSALLIILPLFWLKDKAEGGQDGQHLSFQVRTLFYFALLGQGFVFVEIPLLQRFILYLGQPAYAFAVVVSSLLVAAGLGSRYLAGRLRLRVALVWIVLLTLAYPLLLPFMFEATLWLSFVGRVGLTVLILFPLGAFLGIPFPRGLTLVGQIRPQLTPWAWAVNGCASVVSAVLAAMMALTWGFSVVLWVAALAYGLAWLVIRE